MCVCVGCRQRQWKRQSLCHCRHEAAGTAVIEMRCVLLTGGTIGCNHVFLSQPCNAIGLRRHGGDFIYILGKEHASQKIGKVS